MTLPGARLSALLALLATTALAPAALADVPGPREVCDAEDLPCVTCWQHYGSDPRAAEAYASCRDQATAKGLVEGCRHRTGAGDTVFFCPPGAKPELKTRWVGGSGCRGCAMTSEAPGAATAVVLVGLGIAIIRRRRR